MPKIIILFKYKSMKILFHYKKKLNIDFLIYLFIFIFCFVEKTFPDQLCEQHLARRNIYVPQGDMPAKRSAADRASRSIHPAHEPQANQTRSTAYGFLPKATRDLRPGIGLDDRGMNSAPSQVSALGRPPGSPTADPTCSSSRRVPRRAERSPSAAAGAARRPSAGC